MVNANQRSKLFHYKFSNYQNLPAHSYTVDVKSKPKLWLEVSPEFKLIKRINFLKCHYKHKHDSVIQHKDTFICTGEFFNAQYYIIIFLKIMLCK